MMITQMNSSKLFQCRCNVENEDSDSESEEFVEVIFAKSHIHKHACEECQGLQTRKIRVSRRK